MQTDELCFDFRNKGFQGWTFSTVRCWGERPAGKYELIITDKGGSNEDGMRTGSLVTWSLTLHGSSLSPSSYQNRIQSVK